MRPRVWIVTLILCGSAPASADMASHFGLNPRSMGLGGAYTAVSDDLAALYYNPAGLVQLRGLTVAAGLLSGSPILSESDSRVSMPQEVSYHLHVGVPFSGRLKDYLALGVAANLPWGSYLHTTLYRKQEPYFVLYDGSVQVLQFRAGAGFRVPWRPLSFLTLGVAIQVLGSVKGSIGFYAPFQRGAGDGAASDPDARLEAWADMSVPTTAFVVAGAMAQLGESWRLGATYRSAQQMEVEIPVVMNTRLSVSDTMRIYIPVAGVAKYVAKYHPQQVSLGVSYRNRRLLLTGDLTWLDYSSFRTPAPQMVLNTERLKRDPGLALLLGDDSVLLDPLVPRTRWTDAVVPRVGAEYQILSWLTARAGYSYQHSPLESTDFPIHDCDKHGFSAGARASFLRPLGLLPGWLHLDLSFQDIVYVSREILGSDVGGHVVAVSGGLELAFL